MAALLILEIEKRVEYCICYTNKTLQDGLNLILEEVLNGDKRATSSPKSRGRGQGAS